MSFSQRVVTAVCNPNTELPRKRPNRAGGSHVRPVCQSITGKSLAACPHRARVCLAANLPARRDPAGARRFRPPG